MAMDCRVPLGARIRSGASLRMGLRKDGHGTPAPIAPPKRLVVVGFYQYVVAETRCMSASSLDGLGCGSSSDARIGLR